MQPATIKRKHWFRASRTVRKDDELASTHMRSFAFISSEQELNEKEDHVEHGGARAQDAHATQCGAEQEASQRAQSKRSLLAQAPQTGSDTSIMDSSCSVRSFPHPLARTSSHHSLRTEQETAREAVAAFLDKSKLHVAADLSPVPRFDRDEIVVGKFLGRGAFSDVEEIRGFAHIHVRRSLLRRADTVVEDESRSFIMQHAIRKCGHCRYAIKYITPAIKRRSDVPDRKNSDTSYSAMLDLHIEAKFLQSLVHPNVIKLRAVASQQYEYTRDYFIVLDRLFDTLQHRLTKWKKQKQPLRQSLVRTLFKDRADQQEHAFLVERLMVAHDLGEAVSFLHQRQVLHRDIKPVNCCFDIRNDIKIFDFGMAREMLSDDRLSDGTYKFSIMTGTLRYMAPEVCLGHPYNDRADVYSYTLVLWEMLALQLPFGTDSKSSHSLAHSNKGREKQHLDLVCAKNQRPPIDCAWSPAIQDILGQGWHPSQHSRCGMEQLMAMLREEVVRLRGGDDSGLDTRRRSTYVFESSGREEESIREIAMFAASIGSERSLLSESVSRHSAVEEASTSNN